MSLEQFAMMGGAFVTGALLTLVGTRLKGRPPASDAAWEQIKKDQEAKRKGGGK